MKVFLIAFQMVLTLLILQNSAIAEDQNTPKQAYFTALSDIPLMPGMSEVTDQSFVFDKAEGRVVESVGFLSVSDTDRTIKFYETALVQLGWKPLKTAVFERNGEQLLVRAEKVAQGQFVRFQLSPVSR